MFWHTRAYRAARLRASARACEADESRLDDSSPRSGMKEPTTRHPSPRCVSSSRAMFTCARHRYLAVSGCTRSSLTVVRRFGMRSGSSDARVTDSSRASSFGAASPVTRGRSFPGAAGAGSPALKPSMPVFSTIPLGFHEQSDGAVVMPIRHLCSVVTRRMNSYWAAACVFAWVIGWRVQQAAGEQSDEMNACSHSLDQCPVRLKPDPHQAKPPQPLLAAPLSFPSFSLPAPPFPLEPFP